MLHSIKKKNIVNVTIIYTSWEKKLKQYAKYSGDRLARA